jgi:hypothetical protein
VGIALFSTPARTKFMTASWVVVSGNDTMAGTNAQVFYRGWVILLMGAAKNFSIFWNFPDRVVRKLQLPNNNRLKTTKREFR